MCGLDELDAIVVRITGKHNHITGVLNNKCKKIYNIFILVLIYENIQFPLKTSAKIIFQFGNIKIQGFTFTYIVQKWALFSIFPINKKVHLNCVYM